MVRAALIEVQPPGAAIVSQHHVRLGVTFVALWSFASACGSSGTVEPDTVGTADTADVAGEVSQPADVNPDGAGLDAEVASPADTTSPDEVSAGDVAPDTSADVTGTDVAEPADAGDVEDPINGEPSCSALIERLVVPSAVLPLSAPLSGLIACTDPEDDIISIVEIVATQGFSVTRQDDNLEIGALEKAQGTDGSLTIVAADERGTPADPVVIELYANIPPVANADFVEHHVFEQGPQAVYSLTVEPLANDTDADGLLDPSTLALTAVVGPSSGSWGAANGTVTLVGTCSSTHVWTFRYTVRDDAGAASNEANLMVQVNCGIPR